jgi:uncharacterized membrane protein
VAVSPARALLAHRIALITYGAIIALIIFWEGWAAPPTPLPRAFWIGLKAMPLVALLPWLWHGSARAHVFAALLLLLYFCDGIALAYHAGRSGYSVMLAFGSVEILLALLFIVAASLYARFRFRASPRSDAETGSSHAAD